MKDGKTGQTFGQWLNWDFEVNGFLEIQDTNGQVIYYEDSRDWVKREYDCQGNRIYYENSDGLIIDNRPKPNPELTLESLAGQVFRLAEIVEKLTNKS